APATSTSAWTDHSSLNKIQIVQIERNEFTDTHAGRIQQMEHRKIAPATRQLKVDVLEQTSDLLRSERVRRRLLDARRFQILQRIGGEQARRAQIPEESLERSQLARYCRRTVLLIFTHLQQVGGNMLPRDL